VSWTLKDGAGDALLTEVRVRAPGGGFAWEPFTLDAQIPFQAVPPSSYLDDSGNIVIRFTDSASIKRERKDTLTVDCLVGQVERGTQPLPAPTAPGNLTATPTGSTSITLAWTNSEGETGYDVWRYTQAAGWTFLGSLAENVVAYTDTGLTASTTYGYVIRAFNSQSYTDSAAAQATTEPAETQLFIPENVTAKATKGVVTVTWTDTNADETGYQVLRAESGSDPTVRATLAANATKYTDSQVTKGVTYQYQVRAIAGDALGPVSSPVSVTVR